ncbi:hypothetical protein Tco_0312284 [Tanacetum coccineum]
MSDVGCYGLRNHIKVNKARGAKDTLGIGADEELSDGGAEHQPSPDYVSGPEHPPLPVEEQPLPADASPTALSPGYVADSNPNKDPEEDPEEDHTDYPVDGGDGDDEP